MRLSQFWHPTPCSYGERPYQINTLPVSDKVLWDGSETAPHNAMIKTANLLDFFFPRSRQVQFFKNKQRQKRSSARATAFIRALWAEQICTLLYLKKLKVLLLSLVNSNTDTEDSFHKCERNASVWKTLFQLIVIVIISVTKYKHFLSIYAYLIPVQSVVSSNWRNGNVLERVRAAVMKNESSPSDHLLIITFYMRSSEGKQWEGVQGKSPNWDRLIIYTLI